jgi:hypothetical protein
MTRKNAPFNIEEHKQGSSIILRGLSLQTLFWDPGMKIIMKGFSIKHSNNMFELRTTL